MAANWELVEKCNIWKVLGVIECEYCSSKVACWGEETNLPEEHPLPSEFWNNLFKTGKGNTNDNL